MDMKHQIRHIICDVDGTLLDTETIYTVVTNSITQKYGKEFTWDVKKLMMGRPPHQAASILVDKLDLPITPEEYLTAEKKLIYELWPKADAMPGAEDLVKFFKDHPKIEKIGVATSSLSETFQLKRTKHNWFDLFDIITTGDTPNIKPKPEPDIFLHTANLLGAQPDKTLVFEDSILGVEAAKKAGMVVVQLLDPKLNLVSENNNSQFPPDYVIQNLGDWHDIKHFFGL